MEIFAEKLLKKSVARLESWLQKMNEKKRKYET